MDFKFFLKQFFFVTILAFPFCVFLLPLGFIIGLIVKKKRAQALAKSVVKIKGNDVV